MVKAMVKASLPPGVSVSTLYVRTLCSRGRLKSRVLSLRVQIFTQTDTTLSPRISILNHTVSLGLFSRQTVPSP